MPPSPAVEERKPAAAKPGAEARPVESPKVASVDKLSVILIAVFAFAFLGERPAARDWAGIALVAAGVLILVAKR